VEGLLQQLGITAKFEKSAMEIYIPRIRRRLPLTANKSGLLVNCIPPLRTFELTQPVFLFEIKYSGITAADER